jgi:signal transduction histidine kinase
VADLSEDRQDLYSEYWVAVGRRRSAEQLRWTSYFVLGLQGVFILLDRVSFPEQFLLFLAMRMAVNAVVLAVLLRWRFLAPRAAEYAVCISVGAEILAMVYATGGVTSPYYVGLIILFVGMPVLQPLRGIDAARIAIVFCVGFLASPIFLGGVDEWHLFNIHSVFLLSGAIESVLSCSLLSRARLRDYMQRSEIERARDELKELDVAKSRFTANVHHELRTPLTRMGCGC